MTKDELKELYDKERAYEQSIFGDYATNPNLNVASFLTFIEIYLEKAKKSYAENWQKTSLIPGLVTCKEQEVTGSGPFKTYEELVKIFALAGGALEAFLEAKPEKWREGCGIKPKWEDFFP